ncbi:hypothetical protein DNU06_03120 [Putridiphycobacter roseus]|uniref:DUF4249 domain-containing protein n=1 Tax=Putridiphycobacter roseus TaxID=2219161 RepID=A0A2W1NLW5_9FLAO|nr:DUF4249 family protein [Putridiphycobacter roseus]PZE18836.1 hypothetical protein DNU06_03120 [Putridiphycobacter roseus]
MKKVFTFLLIITAFLQISCEEVIDIPLNDAAQKIVVEAFTSNIEGRSYVKLTKSSTVYTNNNFEKISGASVIITDQNGINSVFLEDSTEKGLYLFPSFKVENNMTYDLKINADGEEITGTATSSFTPSLDLIMGAPISLLPDTLTQGLEFFDPSTRLILYLFSDPIPTGDNYRIIAYINGEKDNNYYITNDLIGSGEQFGGVLFGADVDSADVVHVELLTMDNANYDYFYSLVNNTGTGPFAATPSNPVSNLTNNALGYFGAYLMDTTSFVVF